MAEALARGFISKGVLVASDIVATDPVAARKEVFQSFDVKAVNSNVEVWTCIGYPKYGCDEASGL